MQTCPFHKTLALAAMMASLVLVGEAKTLALWPFGDNVAPDRAAVCARCANNPAFDLRTDSAAVDASMPGTWNLPPNPCTDLPDPYNAIARYALVTTAADGGLAGSTASLANPDLARCLYPTNDFTVEGWMRLDEFSTSAGSWRIIVQAGNGSGGYGGWCLSMRYSDANGFFLNFMSENMNENPYPWTGDKEFPKFIDGSTRVEWEHIGGAWHHYAVAFDYQHPTAASQSRWRLYFDGHLVGTVSQNRFPEGYVITGTSNQLDFGGRSGTANTRLKGAFSYWRVSDEALEPEGFLNDTNGGTQTGTTVDAQPEVTALDLTSRDVANHRWVNTGVRLTGQAVSNCTFETWVNCTNANTWLVSQFSSGDYRSQWRTEYWKSDGLQHLVFQIYDPVASAWIYYKSTRGFAPSTWHHVALVIDGDFFRFYIDGFLDSEESHPGVHLATDTSNCDGVVIGNQRLWYTPYNPNGSAAAAFAEARVWNRARTVEEIRANLHIRLDKPENETNLIGYWPLCDGVAGENADGLLAYNYARLDAQATGFWLREAGSMGYSPIRGFITNGVWKSYSTLAITGAAPHAVIAAFCPEGGYTNAATTEVTNQYNRFTFTGWYFFSSLSAKGSERSLMAKAYHGNGRMHLRERDGGELYLWLGGGEGGATNEQLVVTAAEAGLHVGRWTHLAVVREGRKFSIYVDGVLKGESAAFTLPTHAFAPFQFGGFFAGGSWGVFNGLVREVGLWKKALTPEQIVETMTKRPAATERKLLGYWPCDEGEGNALRNLKEGGAPALPIGGSETSFHWRSLTLVPLCDGTFALPTPGLTILVR